MQTKPLIQSLFFACSVSAAILLSGCCCTAAPRDPAPAEERQVTDIGAKLLEAIRQQDYSDFAELLPPSLQQLLGPEAFQEQCNTFANQFGTMQQYELLTELETPAFCHYIYKVTFERNGQDNSPIRQEILFRLITGELDQTEQIICFGFL